jgi:SAM-dependent methyltransferase
MQVLDNRPLWGVDRSEGAVLWGKQSYGLNLWVGDVPGLPLGAETVGVVTMWHVLEHLSQPLLALQDVARVLTPNGVLVLACPMADSWEAAVFGRYWAGYDVPRHLYAFSRQTLPRLLAKAGFEAREVPGIVLGFNSFKISSALWLRGQLGWPDSGLSRRLAAILAAAGTLVSDALSCVSALPGSVGVYVAHKRAERASAPKESQG